MRTRSPFVRAKLLKFIIFGDCHVLEIQFPLCIKSKLKTSSTQFAQTLILWQFSVQDTKQSFTFAVISFILNT